MVRGYCTVCENEISVMIFRNSGVCSENCRKIRDESPHCIYEARHTDEVGYIAICVVHGSNSKHEITEGPHRPCLTVDPYDADDIRRQVENSPIAAK